ncbi:MAG: LON peptidase substrate-binding domain-containing protein [Acidobacteriota bacterium]|nr:LON peptidase substrate-binding domain-containing protein [Acidobacteriota bacterium]
MDAHRIIPIFPLPLVQFPGAVTPLHIFEPRYRQMIKDLMAGDKTFGIIYRNDETMMDFEQLPPGSIGCAVEIAVQQEMPDGRSNLLCVGVSRFSLVAYVEGEPYEQAQVEFFDDDIAFDDLSVEISQAKNLFQRLSGIIRKLKGEKDEEEDLMPDLPDDPQALSFILAAYLDIEISDKQDLLEMTDTAERLREVIRLLENLADDYEKRAFASQLSKKNGHAGHMPKFD